MLFGSRSRSAVFFCRLHQLVDFNIAGIFNGVKGIIDGLCSGVEVLFSGFGESTNGITDGLFNGVDDRFSGVKVHFNDFGDFTNGSIDGLFSGLFSGVVDCTTGVDDRFTGVDDRFTGFVGDVVDYTI